MSRFGKGEEDELEATPEIQVLVNKVKKQVEENLSKKFKTFKAVKFIQQGFNGINYKIKIRVDNGAYLHIVVEEELRRGGSELYLDVVTEGKTFHSSLLQWG